MVVLGCPSGCAGWLGGKGSFVRTLPLHVVIPSHFHSFPSRRRSISRQPTDQTWMALLSSRHSFLQGSLAVPRFFLWRAPFPSQAAAPNHENHRASLLLLPSRVGPTRDAVLLMGDLMLAVHHPAIKITDR